MVTKALKQVKWRSGGCGEGMWRPGGIAILSGFRINLFVYNMKITRFFNEKSLWKMCAE